MRSSPAIRRKPRGLTAPILAAIEMMTFDGTPWEVAADKAGLSRRTMRRALDKPGVVAYLRDRKRSFLAAASAANIAHLVRLRDTSANAMAALGAIKVLETDGEADHGRTEPVTPGVVIVIGEVRPL